MSRPRKCRFVKIQPDVTYFKPRAIPLSMLEEVVLTVEELEALRLHDVKNLTEQQACKKMRISRTTFHRILVSAQKKVANALVYGKAIRIEGGDYKLINK
jgi:predicted DNA-binding protein (UPF0251 family)